MCSISKETAAEEEGGTGYRDDNKCDAAAAAAAKAAKAEEEEDYFDCDDMGSDDETEIFSPALNSNHHHNTSMTNTMEPRPRRSKIMVVMACILFAEVAYYLRIPFLVLSIRNWLLTGRETQNQCVAENTRPKPATAGHPPWGLFPAYTVYCGSAAKIHPACNNQLVHRKSLEGRGMQVVWNSFLPTLMLTLTPKVDLPFIMR